MRTFVALLLLTLLISFPTYAQSSATYEWLRTGGSVGSDRAIAIDIDSLGNVYVLTHTPAVFTYDTISAQ